MGDNAQGVIWVAEELHIAGTYIILHSGINFLGNYYERRFYLTGPHPFCYYYENQNGSIYETYPSGVHEYTSPDGGGWWRIDGVVIPK